MDEVLMFRHNDSDKNATHNPGMHISNDDPHSILQAADLVMDCTAGTVECSGQQIKLFPMEFRLLEFLLRHPNQTFSSQALRERIWRKNGVTAGTVRTHIKTLRRKVDSGRTSPLIRTDHRRGYRLQTEMDSSTNASLSTGTTTAQSEHASSIAPTQQDRYTATSDAAPFPQSTDNTRMSLDRIDLLLLGDRQNSAAAADLTEYL